MSKGIKMEKYCGKCRKWKQTLGFSNDKNTKDGLSYWCKECQRGYRKGRQKTPYKDLPEEKKLKYSRRATERRQEKLWRSGKPLKSWYCTWPDRVCSRCSERKHVNNYGLRKGVKSGVCKDCTNEEMALYREKNPRLGFPPNLLDFHCHCITKAKNVVNMRLKTAEKIKNRGELWGRYCEWPNKTCKGCKKELPRWHYFNNKNMRDGIGTKCRVCRGLKQKDEKEFLRKKVERAKTKKKRRYLAEKLAQPDWLSPRQLIDIERVYEHMRDCTKVTGEPYHVNHITPLRGDTVCGLHVPWNLEVLPADVNIKLSNTFDGGW